MCAAVTVGNSAHRHVNKLTGTRERRRCLRCPVTLVSPVSSGSTVCGSICPRPTFKRPTVKRSERIDCIRRRSPATLMRSKRPGLPGVPDNMMRSPIETESSRHVARRVAKAVLRLIAKTRLRLPAGLSGLIRGTTAKAAAAYCIINNLALPMAGDAQCITGAIYVFRSALISVFIRSLLFAHRSARPR